MGLLTANYQALVAALRERDNIVKGEFDRHSARMVSEPLYSSAPNVL